MKLIIENLTELQSRICINKLWQITGVNLTDEDISGMTIKEVLDAYSSAPEADLRHLTLHVFSSTLPRHTYLLGWQRIIKNPDYKEKLFTTDEILKTWEHSF